MVERGSFGKPTEDNLRCDMETIDELKIWIRRLDYEESCGKSVTEERTFVCQKVVRWAKENFK